MEPEHTHNPNRTEQTQDPMPQAAPAVGPEADATNQQTETPLLAPVPFYKKKSFAFLIIALIIILGGAYYAYTSGLFAPAVAEVNGSKITEAELNENIALIEASAAQQGINLAEVGAEEAIRNQALESLINNELLLSAAKREGVTASDEEMTEIYNQLVSDVGSEELLLGRMAEIGLTEERLLSNIRERILADKYIEATTDIEDIQVTDEEIADFYAGLEATATTELPPLEGLRTEIAGQIRLQKQQAILAEVMERLRNEADIVIY